MGNTLCCSPKKEYYKERNKKLKNKQNSDNKFTHINYSKTLSESKNIYEENVLRMKKLNKNRNYKKKNAKINHLNSEGNVYILHTRRRESDSSESSNSITTQFTDATVEKQMMKNKLRSFPIRKLYTQENDMEYQKMFYSPQKSKKIKNTNTYG
jgi:hypothetical protein